MSLELDPNHIFRDFVIDGMPASGANDPRKVEIRQHLSGMWQAVIALLADANPGLALPNLLIRYTVTGGTADAIIATPNLVPPSSPGLALFSIQIAQDNTGPVTINGKPWLTNTGKSFVAGGLKAGGVYLLLDNGGHFRALTDQDVSALVASAETSVLAAQAAKDNAVSAMMAAATSADNATGSAADAQSAKTQAELAAIAAGAPLFTDPPNLASAPSPYLLQVDAGAQVWTHNGTTRTLVGWLGQVRFPTVAQMLSFSGPLGPIGTEVQAGNNRHSVVDGSDPNAWLETNGGEWLRPIVPSLRYSSDFIARRGPREIEIIAHRGFRDQSPENTLMALSTALRQGADSLECDVQVSADGTAWLFHDETVDTLTNGTGRFTELSDAYIASLRLVGTKSPFGGIGITPLKDALKMVAEAGCYIYPEIKHYRAQSDISIILDDIQAVGVVDLCRVQSFIWSDLEYIRALEPRIAIAALSSSQSVSNQRNAIRLMAKLGNGDLAWRDTAILERPALIQEAYGAGVGLVVWTVNNVDTAKRFIAMGANRIMSDISLARYF